MNILKKIAVFTVALMLISVMAFADTQRLGTTTTIGFNPTATVTKTAVYTVLSTDSWVKGNMTSSAFTFTLPTIASLQALGISKSYKFSKTDSSTNMLTIASASGDTIGGEASRKVINQNDYIIIRMGSGRDWVVSYESSYLAENHYAGTVALVGGATSYNLYTAVATSTVLTSANCGQTLGFTAQATMTLPPSIANCQIRFLLAQAPATMSISVYVGQKIFGAVATNANFIGTASAGIRASAAYSATGAYATLLGDGSNWFVVGGGGQAVWGLQ